MSHFNQGRDDSDVRALLSAQRPPPHWCVLRVSWYPAHTFSPRVGTRSHCGLCPLLKAQHDGAEKRVLVLLVNGPLRHVSFLTDDLEELPHRARFWVQTLFNIADAANVRLDSWVAYDGKGAR